MKKVIFSIIVFFMFTICFVGKVSAKDTVCRYKINSDSYGYRADSIKLTIKNAKKQKMKIEIKNMILPELEGDKGYSKIVFNSQKTYNVDVTKSLKGEVYHYHAGTDPSKFEYIDESVDSKKDKLPDFDLNEGECPEYVMFVVNDVLKTKDSFAFIYGDNNRFNFIKSRVDLNPEYNYMIYGNKNDYELPGEDVNPDSNNSGDENGEDSGEPDEDLNTCEGLLGNKVNDEYAEGTVGYLLQKIFDYMKMAVVILVFAFSIIDYAKAIAAQDSEVFKKANINFLKRIAFGIVFFLIPELVDLILSVIDASSCGIK